MKRRRRFISDGVAARFGRTSWRVSAVLSAYCLLLTLLGGASLLASLPPNVVLGKGDLPTVRSQLNLVASQRFAFFTRPPQSEEINAVRVAGDRSLGESLLHTPQSRVENYLGLSRRQRAQGPELATLVQAVSEESWTDCGALNTRHCLDYAAGLESKAKVKNTSPLATICGDVLLIIEQTTKWAYRDLERSRSRAVRAVLVSAECNGR